MTKQLWDELETAPPPKNVPAIMEEKALVVDTPKPVDQDQLDDFELSRDTIRDVLRKGKDALDELVDIASQEQTPRMYEVVSTLIKTMAETAKDLQTLHEKKQKMALPSAGIKDKPVDDTIVNVDKAIFLGTTTELLKQIKDNQKNNK